jgi:uncharacterized iron-regulated protein
MFNPSSGGSCAPRRSPPHTLAGVLLLAACASGCGASSSAAPPLAPRAREPLPADIVAKSALPLHALAAGTEIREPEVWERMASSRVICFGEQHDSPQHHYAQARALKELATRSVSAQRTLAVGFEMFQRPYQAALTGLVTGQLPEAQFLIDSDYAQRWGFDFALYRPLLDTAREFRLEALALNAPKELTRKIGHAGLDGLDSAERSGLPELDMQNADHKAYFTAAMGDHPMPAGAPKLEDMYAAQVVWDETMAQTAADWLSKAGPSSQLLLVAGAGHCHRTAIPARITRRTQIPVLSVTPVLRSELAAYTDRERYDWLIVLED